LFFFVSTTDPDLPNSWKMNRFFGGKQSFQGHVYPELETLETKEQMEAFGKKKLEQLKSLVSDGGWTPVEFAAPGGYDVKVHSKPTSDSLLNTQLGDAILPAPAHEVLKIAFSTNAEELKAWDVDLLTVKVLQELSPNAKLYISTHVTPFPINTREFVALRFQHIDPDGTCYCWGASLNRLDVPETSGNVRGVIDVSGWIIEPIKENPNTCRCRRIFRIDPKGLIPVFIVNSYKAKAGHFMVTLNNHLLKNKN